MSWNDGKDNWGPFRDAAIPTPRKPSPWELDMAFANDLFPNDPRVDDYAQTLQTYWAAQRAWSRWRHKRRVIAESLVVVVGSLVVMAWTWWRTDVSRTTGAMLELDLEAAEQAMVDGLARRLGR